MQPKGQINKDKKSTEKQENSVDENVKFYGKVAKFPKRVKASNAYNFLEKVSKFLAGNLKFFPHSYI